MEETQAVSRLQQGISNEVMSITLNQLTEWVFRKIHTNLNGQILEVGDGTFASTCAQNNLMVHDINSISAESYNTIIVADMEASILNIHITSNYYIRQLVPNGHLISLSRVNTALYNTTNKAFGYWHNHNKRIIQKSLHKDFVIIKMRYFSLVNTPNYLCSKKETDYYKSIQHFYISDSNKTNQECVFLIMVAKKISK